jgi:hypothetical protein
VVKKTYRKGQFKPKDYYSEPTSTGPAAPPYTLKTKLILRMDKIMDGSFAGLYQLVNIKETGEEKVLTDANTVQYIILQAHKAIMSAL